MKETLINAMVKRAESVRTAAELLMEQTQDWQIIQQYLCNRIQDSKLTAQQEEKLKRYQFAYNQLISGRYSEQEVISQLMNIYHLKISQAYEDINGTREIFSTVLSINKKFEQKQALEIAKSCQAKCIEMNDMKGAAAFNKNIMGLTRDIGEIEENPADLFLGHSIEAVFDPTLLGAPAIDMQEVLKAVNERRKVKINTDMFEELEIIKDEPTTL